MNRKNGRLGRIGWMMFDWASQPYHTLIITFIFAPYFASAIASDPTSGQEIWARAVWISGLIVAIGAPILGAIADAIGPRKPWILAFSLTYVIASAALWIGAPGMADPTAVLVAFAVGLIAVEFAFVFCNAMMPDLASKEIMGEMSGQGWSIGYLGGVVSLIIMLALFAEDAATGKTLVGLDPIFGLDPEAREGTRAVGPLTALWYLVFMIPFFLLTPDTARPAALSGALRRGMGALWASIRDLRARPDFSWFLAASMFYRDALNGFYVFGGIYAVGVLGWGVVDLGVFGIIAAIAGAVGCWVGGSLDRIFGPRPLVMATVLILVFASIFAVSISRESILFVIPAGDGAAPDICFYVAGALVGAAGGALQASSRTLVAWLADEGRMTASYGLYALAGRATAFLAPLLVEIATRASGDQQMGVAPIVGLFVLGWLLMLFVRLPQADRAA